MFGWLSGEAALASGSRRRMHGSLRVRSGRSTFSATFRPSRASGTAIRGLVLVPDPRSRLPSFLLLFALCTAGLTVTARERRERGLGDRHAVEGVAPWVELPEVAAQKESPVQTIIRRPSTISHTRSLCRSVLAQRFTDLVGEAPMRYLANWRMQVAKQMMRDGARNIQEVATRVGYDSEAAFNRAFKRATGSPPAAWRKGALGV